MDKVKEIADKLVLTDHAKQRREDRSYISRNQIIEAIAFGQHNFAGNLRYKKFYKGIYVVYKVDRDGNYVVISFYPPKKSSKNRGNKRKKSLVF